MYKAPQPEAGPWLALYQTVVEASITLQVKTHQQRLQAWHACAYHPDDEVE
jgi:hypothetical protein